MTGALAAFVAAGALAGPASAQVLPDNFPSPQAKLANAEFLAQAPAPATGAGTVCVIDTGVSQLADLDTQVIERISAVGGNGEDIYHQADNPYSGHGTFVASTIASRVDGVGSAGIWPAAKIISVRVARAAGSNATSADYRTAISECARVDRGVDVINLSLGASYIDADDLARLENKIINARRDKNINVVASTGNDGNNIQVNYPARFADAFAIGATDPNGAFCSFSNRGTGLDLSALGCNTYATGFDGGVGAFHGTSFAAPTAAAVLVALRSYMPGLTANAAEELLLRTARQTAAGPVLDAAAAFRAAGLGALVDAYVAPQLPNGGGDAAGGGNTPPGGPEVVTKVDVTHVPDVVETKLSKPKARKASLKRGTLTVQVAKPPKGAVAVFRVGGRSYERKNGKLTLKKVRSWRTVTVFIEDQWGVRSDSLKVRRPTGRR
ncbi:S8 family peptidase [Solirubrobacter pauli]|uniref:S8 family peptidase n=1 Tax=Solirubrobacter pauli TaxID=166793 RepID=UPI0014778888|nr:S8 family serine peptidase [Solirubrobacter pauli]